MGCEEHPTALSAPLQVTYIEQDDKGALRMKRKQRFVKVVL